ncbi:MAG: DEAD/DEAH box helicase, partial [Acidobacteriota bacterium]
MSLFSRSRYRNGRRRKRNDQEESARKPEKPFVFKLHRNIRPVLERIGIPDPQPFVPDPFQIEALETLEKSDVLVTAPTGAGKTYIAIEAIDRIFQKGGKSWYASPLKALSNAKYEEFSKIFGPENVGILTGDRKENGHAPVIVGTTEILRNQLYDNMHRGENLDVDLVVLDEAHYLGDEDRGVVWEEVLIYLPPRVRLLLLSATIRNAREICGWLQWLRSSPCDWVAAYERPVPLYPLFLFPEGELSPLSTRRGLFGKIHSVDPRSFSRRDFPDIPKIMDVLRQADLLPAIFFLKSRSDCEKAIAMCHPSVGTKGRQGADDFRKRVNELLEEFPFLKTHQHLAILKQSRVGAHHGGQLPHWKILLERLMQETRLEAIFSTSTVAAGVNFPARTVVILQSDRFNGKEFVPLRATDLLQMTGRAGRRGMDEIGFVLVLPGPHQDAELIHSLLRSPPDSIESQIRVNHSMVLNLLLSHKPEEIRNLFASSFATYQNMSGETQIAEEFEEVRRELDQWVPEAACGTLERLAEVRPLYGALKEQMRKAKKIWKKQAASAALQTLLEPGRLFLSQRGTTYVAMEEPDMQYRNVNAVRLAFPLRFRRGEVKLLRVSFHRIRDIGEKLDVLPDPEDREGWEALASEMAGRTFRSVSKRGENSPALDEVTQDMTGLIHRKADLPCDECAIFGPCQKSGSHPFEA